MCYNAKRRSAQTGLEEIICGGISMNNRFKAFVASVLAVMMIFTLAACGGSGDGGNAQGEGGTKPGSQSIGDYAYVSSFKEFDKANLS